MKWWPKRAGNGDAKDRAKQEALLRAAQRMTPVYEHLADHVAELPAEELARRMRAAFTRRPT